MLKPKSPQFLSLTIAFASFFSFISFVFAQYGITQEAQFSTLSSSEAEIVFGDKGIREINSLQYQTKFLHSPDESPLFRIAVKQIGRFNPAWLQSTDATSHEKSLDANTMSQKYIFTNGIEVICKTVLENNISTWSIQIMNHSDQEVAIVQYPLLSGLSVDQNELDDTQILPTGWKQLIRNPVHNELSNYRNLAMRWSYLFDSTAGIYFGDHNWPIHDLTFLMAQDSSTTMSFGFQHEIRIRPGTETELPNQVIALLKGGEWHLAADIYRDWAKEKIEAPNNPAWTSITDGWSLYQGGRYPNSGYSGILDSYDAGVQRGLNHFFYSMRAMIDGPRSYAGLWPTYCPADGTLKEFQDAIKYIRLHGGHTNWYFNWQLLSPARVIDRTRIASVIPKNWIEHFVPWPTKEWYESTVLHWFEWSDTNLGNEMDEISQCIGSTNWQQHLCDRTKDWVDIYGADGMYYDQISAINNFCGSLEHGHDDYGIWTSTTATHLKKITEDMRTINPHFATSGEFCNDVIGQYINFHLTSGTFNRLELFQYCFPDQILLDGTQNLGSIDHVGGIDRWRYIWMCGARFDGIPADSYLDQLLALRRKVKPLLYASRFMDTVGIELQLNGKQIENPPQTVTSGVEIASVSGPQAKWFLLKSPNTGAIINFIQDPESMSSNDSLSVSIPTSDFGIVQHAWLFRLDGKMEKIDGKNENNRYSFSITNKDKANTILLVNNVYPQILNATMPYSSSSGTKLSGTVTIVNYGSEKGNVTIESVLPSNWQSQSHRIALSTGEKKEVSIDLAIPENETLTRKDLQFIAKTENYSHTYPHWITIEKPLVIRLARNEDGSVAISLINLSGNTLADNILLSAPAGCELDKTVIPFSVKAFSTYTDSVSINGLYNFDAPIPLTVQTEDTNLSDPRVLTLFLPLPNGHFENDSAGDGMADYWLFGRQDADIGYIPLALDKTNPYSGNSCVRIDPSDDPSMLNVAKPIVSFFDSNRAYRFRGALKKVNAADDAYIRILPRPEDQNLTSNVSNKWVMFEDIFIPYTSNLSVEIINKSKNPIWIDDLSLVPFDSINKISDYGIFEKSIDWVKHIDYRNSYRKPGNLTVNNNNGNLEYTMEGNGERIGYVSDDGFYVYKELSGNQSISAQFEWLIDPTASTDSSPEVGLMIRDQAKNSISKNCFIALTKYDHVQSKWRDQEEKNTTIVYADKAWKWLRLSRVDQNTFRYERSQDGITWEEICTQAIAMNDTIAYGIAITNGYNNELLAKAKVTDVKIVKVEDTYTPTPTEPPTATPISGNVKVLYSNDFNKPISNIPGTAWPEWIDFGGNTARAVNGQIEWYDSGGNDDWLRLDKQLPTNFVMEFDFFYQENINGRFSVWPLVKPGENIYERANYFLRKDTHYFNGSNVTPSAGARDLTLPLGSNPHRLRFEINGDRVVFRYKNRGDGNWILVDERDFPPFGNSLRYIQVGYNHDGGTAGIHWIDNIVIYEQLQTPTSTPTLTIAPVSTPTRKPTATPTATYTKMPTFTPTPSLPGTPTNTSTPSFTPTFTHTPSPSHTPTFTPSPTPIPILIRWEFNTDNDQEGWQGSGIANLSVSGGILKGAADTNDPLLQKMGINVPTRYISGIAVRFRANQASALQVFIATMNGEWKFQYIQDLPYTGENEFQTYVIPLALNGAENQVLDLLRIDPAVNPGVQFEIDWIGLISSGVQQPTPTFTPMPAPTPTYSPTPKPVGVPGWELY